MAIIAYDPTAKTSYGLEYSDTAGREAAAKAGLQLSTGDTSGLNPYQYKRVDDTSSSTDTSKLYGSDTSNAIDEAAIRKAEEERIAQQIKAIEGVYAGEILKAKKQGTERVGQQTAMSTVRGGAGSDFAQTAKTNIESANTQAEQAILAQMNAEIAAARAQGGTNERANIEAAYKNAISKKALADAAIETEKTKFSDAQTIASTAAQSGVPYANLDAATREILSKYYGTGAEAVYKKLGQSATKGVEVSSGASYIDPTTGKLIYQSPYKPTTESTPSSYREWELAGGQTGTGQSYADYIKKTTGTDLTPYQKFQATQAIAKDTQARTEQAREMSRQATLIQNSYANIEKGGDRSLNTQAIITSFNKILDPTSVVRESEYDRTAAGQSLINRLQGKYDNIVQGGAGVSLQTLKEARDIANEYIKGAKSSIDSQNKRAQEMARQFGLNEDFVTSTSQSDTTQNTTEDSW